MKVRKGKKSKQERKEGCRKVNEKRRKDRSDEERKDGIRGTEVRKKRRAKKGKERRKKETTAAGDEGKKRSVFHPSFTPLFLFLPTSLLSCLSPSLHHPPSSLSSSFLFVFFCPLTAENTWPSCLCSSVVSILSRTLWGPQRFHERRHESCWDLKANHASSENGIDSL